MKTLCFLPFFFLFVLFYQPSEGKAILVPIKIAKRGVQACWRNSACRNIFQFVFGFGAGLTVEEILDKLRDIGNLGLQKGFLKEILEKKMQVRL